MEKRSRSKSPAPRQSPNDSARSRSPRSPRSSRSPRRDRDNHSHSHSHNRLRHRSYSGSRSDPRRSRRDDETDRRGRDRTPKPATHTAEEPGTPQVNGNSDSVDNEIPETDLMAQMMGFGSFGTTKQKKHSDIGAVRKDKASKFRQYMNRAGGFNRALSPPPGEK